MARRRFSESELNALFGSGPAAAIREEKRPEKPIEIQSERPPEIMSKTTQSDAPQNIVEEISPDRIYPNPYQPRVHFDEAKLEEMASSIRNRGVLQPLLVRKYNDIYQLIAGERRLRAAKKANLKKVPVIVSNLSDQELLEVALIENLQRDDLNAIEEARAYDSLSREFGLSHEEIAGRVGKDRTTIVNTLRLLRLPSEIQADVQSKRISAGHARALLALDNEEQMMKLRAMIHETGLSVRQTEDRVRELLGQKHAAKSKTSGNAVPQTEVTDLENRLTEAIGCQVRLRPTSSFSGKIEILYSSLDELDRICDTLGLDSSNT